jgi:hypothetical protein
MEKQHVDRIGKGTLIKFIGRPSRPSTYRLQNGTVLIVLYDAWKAYKDRWWFKSDGLLSNLGTVWFDVNVYDDEIEVLVEPCDT